MATIDLVIPTYNEERVLRDSVVRTLAFLDGHPEHAWRVVIADNGSRDRTPAIARELEAEHPGRVVALDVLARGRGIALRVAWLTSPAEVCAYMDADLSTDLAHLPELVDPVAADEADVTLGTRLHPGAARTRSRFRELTSRGYILLLRHLGGLRVSDAQCGFKALRREAVRALVPLVRDDGWFFDSELLLVAQESGYRLREVPVRWVEDRDSRVQVLRTAWRDLRGIWRVRRQGVPRAPRQPAAGA